MNTIITNKENTIIINKSKFICCLYIINDIDEVYTYLNDIRDKYKDATHYCYAYIVDNQKRCNDDKEPSGTAGLPILNVLEKNDLTNVLCIVVRYFGGIKLGAGGLVRAYTGSVVSGLNNNIKPITKGLEIEILFNYDKVKLIDNILKNSIINKEFDEFVTYKFTISYDDYNLIKDKLKDICLKVNVLSENIVI
jgi:uncharacterized YigZ family protein